METITTQFGDYWPHHGVMTTAVISHLIICWILSEVLGAVPEVSDRLVGDKLMCAILGCLGHVLASQNVCVGGQGREGGRERLCLGLSALLLVRVSIEIIMPATRLNML